LSGDGSIFSGAIIGAPVRLRIGREDGRRAEGIGVVGNRWVGDVERDLGSGFRGTMGGEAGEAPTPDEATKLIPI
jgi:hypothetical protein